MKKQSPNAKCRVLGCQEYVPSYGELPGLPQAHCTRCGKLIEGNASHDRNSILPEFDEPTYPEADWMYRIYEKILNLKNEL